MLFQAVVKFLSRNFWLLGNRSILIRAEWEDNIFKEIRQHDFFEEKSDSRTPHW
jgi:hypothetical protein